MSSKVRVLVGEVFDELKRSPLFRPNRERQLELNRECAVAIASVYKAVDAKRGWANFQSLFNEQKETLKDLATLYHEAPSSSPTFGELIALGIPAELCGDPSKTPAEEAHEAVLAKKQGGTHADPASSGPTSPAGAPQPGGSPAPQHQLAQSTHAAGSAPSAVVAAKPTIQVNDVHLPDVLDAAGKALVAANNPPVMFMRNGGLVYIDGMHHISEHTSVTCRTRLGHVARWHRKTGVDRETELDKFEWVFPPQDVASAIVAEPPAGLPELKEVVNYPVFGKSGRLITTPGYHPGEAIFVTDEVVGLVPPVPYNPSESEVAAAKRLIAEVICDFRFASPADEAHYHAALVLPVVRRMIDGPTPNHLFEAACVGTGKTMLADTIALTITGRPVPWKKLPEEENEKSQTIFTILKSGSLFAGFDNVKDRVDSGALEAALTTTEWSARLMRTQSDGTVHNHAMWLMTANNAEFSDDLLRRSLRIRQDAGEEKPALRTGFKHPNLRKWVGENRGQLLHAVLTLVQAWVAGGCKPYSGKPLASYESWSAVVGGILEAVGIDHFLEVNLAEEASSNMDEDASFLAAWWQKFEYMPVSAKDLYNDVCLESIGVELGGKTLIRTQLAHLGGFFGRTAETARTKRLGHWLKKHRDQPIDGMAIRTAEYDANNKVHRFKLELIGQKPQAAKTKEASEGLNLPPAVDGDNPDFGSGENVGG